MRSLALTGNHNVTTADFHKVVVTKCSIATLKSLCICAAYVTVTFKVMISLLIQGSLEKHKLDGKLGIQCKYESKRHVVVVVHFL